MISVIPTYEIDAFQHPVARKEELEAELNLVKRYQDKHPGQLPRKYWFIPFWKHKSIPEIEKDLKEVDQKYEKLWEEFDPKRKGHRAFLTFRSQRATWRVDSKGPSFISDLCVYFSCRSEAKDPHFKGKAIRFYQPPGPDELKWYNSGSSLLTKLKVNGLISLAALAFLFIIFGIITVISEYSQFHLSKFYGTLVAVVLVVVQRLSFYLYNWLLQREIYIDNATHENAILWKKLIFGILFNVFLPLLVYNEPVKWFSAGNLADTVFTAVCLQGLLVNLLLLLEGFQIWEKVKRCFQNRVGLSQQEINIQYEGPEPDLRKLMESQLPLLILALIYMSIVPLIAHVAFISLLVSYILFRVMIARCYRMPRIRYHALFGLSIFMWTKLFLIVNFVLIIQTSSIVFMSQVRTQNIVVLLISCFCSCIIVLWSVNTYVRAFPDIDDFMLKADVFLEPVFLIQSYEVANPFATTEDLQPFKQILARIGTGRDEAVSNRVNRIEDFVHQDQIPDPSIQIEEPQLAIHTQSERISDTGEFAPREKTKEELRSAMESYIARQKNRDDMNEGELANLVRIAAIHEAEAKHKIPFAVLCRLRNSLAPEWREKIKGKFLVDSSDEGLLTKMKRKWRSLQREVARSRQAEEPRIYQGID